MSVDEKAGPSKSVPLRNSTPQLSVFARFRRYLEGADLDEAEDAGVSTMVRLPNPLPFSVNAVALGQLITNGLTIAGAALGLVVAFGSVIVMPFVIGREGVGLGMITLFVSSIAALCTLIPFFAARGAARVLRRDPRGLRTVYRAAWFYAFGAFFACIIALALPFAASMMPSEGSSTFFIGRSIIGAVSTFAFQVWSIVILRQYKIEVADEIALAEKQTSTNVQIKADRR